MDYLTPQDLNAIVDNPQALVNEEARMSLQELFTGMGAEGTELFNDLLYTLQNALNSAITQVFLVFLFVSIIALVVNMFLKGIPPQRRKED